MSSNKFPKRFDKHHKGEINGEASMFDRSSLEEAVASNETNEVIDYYSNKLAKL